MRDFINENSISFEQGSRNSSITTLIGYAQFKGLTKEELKLELSKEIIEDSFIKEEIDRLWDYCKARNYKNWWSTTEAKLQYTF
jgi:hypothetical protein